MSRHKVLIIHALRPTSRQTTIDHLLAFREYLRDADVQYLHFAQPLPKGLLDQVEPDLLIVNYDFLNYRFTPLWLYIKNRHRNLARQSRKVVAIAQDDFWAHRLLDNWCMSWKVDRVLTQSIMIFISCIRALSNVLSFERCSPAMHQTQLNRQIRSQYDPLILGSEFA